MRPAPPGSTIGIVTPASPPETRADVERGVAWWESNGYRVKFAPGAFESDYWHAGSPEVRARDLQSAFADPEVDAIQTLRGGYGSAQVIPLLDMRAIADAGKWLIGMSDITALHCALQDVGSIYGPSLTGMGRDEPTDARLLELLSGGPVPVGAAATIVPGTASGRLAGGCLTDLVHTIGTPWEVDLADAVFFFEEVGRAPIQIDRALLHLQQAGKLDSVRAVVVGDLVGCGPDEWPPDPGDKTLAQVLEARLAHLGVPVMSGLPTGHGSRNLALPLGATATLDAGAGSLTFG